MLSAADKKRYARQVLLTEIGVGGQARMLQSAVAPPRDADSRAVEVALEYATRAGLRSEADASTQLAVPTSEAVRVLAGRPELQQAAAALAGAFATVEAIKHVLGAGRPAGLPVGLALDREPAA
jgi:hypothetical protein